MNGITAVAAAAAAELQCTAGRTQMWKVASALIFALVWFKIAAIVL